jgi:hypothetical protein
MSQQPGMVGPLERGHKPEDLVLGVMYQLMPEHWDGGLAFTPHPRVVAFRIVRPDGLQVQAEITHDAINSGDTRYAVRRVVETLRLAE